MFHPTWSLWRWVWTTWVTLSGAAPAADIRPAELDGAVLLGATELAAADSARLPDAQPDSTIKVALNGLGRREEAAGALLEILRRDRGWNEQAARLQLLKLFEAWGMTDPATLAARRKLSALLFS